MRQPSIKTSDQIIKNQRVTLLELLDKLLDKGVAVKGEVLLSVADIDLVYLNLGVLLSSVKTVEKAAEKTGEKAKSICAPFPPLTPLIPSPPDVVREQDVHTRGGVPELISPQTSALQEFPHEVQLEVERKDSVPISLSKETNQHTRGTGEFTASALPAAIDYGMDQLFAPKASIDPKNVEKGLAKLVLTLIDLIRKLMEKQAVRRMDAGQLNEQEIEGMGTTFLLLDEKMEQLKQTFGLEGEDLNLDLGPLGDLL